MNVSVKGRASGSLGASWDRSTAATIIAGRAFMDSSDQERVFCHTQTEQEGFVGDLNPAVTAYIGKSVPFARPIFERLRRLFHEACPAIEEKLKWNCPSFEYKGMV